MKSLVLLLLSFCFFNQPSQKELPEMNALVIQYVKTVVGKKVDRGECWDLANQALTYAQAKWERPLLFGKLLKFEKDSLLPGDIIQFTGVTMEHKEGSSTTRWSMIKHTAVVYEVHSSRQLILAEQNINNVKRVMLNEYNLDDIKSGKVQFFRPVK
ncbi:MAG: hypothetical protein KBB37_01080 [Bacteroidia bacterium]|jgi:hypothetical protein|nr:hypothetical protein [Bacteroidia bacterium]MBP7259851.1 hypothetical protein [Bacteroidia bacterium]MBP9179209.1 hypothetical protein [Bacteroidia bacterium]MBP9723510.1 hypothetical protein [Bacteroidia bacterium]